MLQICRTCLEETSDSDFLSLNNDSINIKQELRACIPELDLNLIPNPTMCVYCANSLHAAYDFKQKCLRTEEKIKILKRSSEEDLDLLQIRQEPDEKFDIVHGVGIGMEVIFIRDDGEEQEDEVTVNGNVKDEFVNSFLNYAEESNPGTLGVTKNNLEETELKNTFKTSNYIKTRSNRLNGDKTFKCDICAYTTLQENLFTLHMKSHSVMKPYACEKCTFQTSNRKYLLKHIRTCTKPLRRKKLPKRIVFKCSQCNFRALRKEGLKEHEKNVHLKLFKCTQCSFKVSNLSTFKRHVNIHSTEKSHKCKQCEYACDDSVTLSNHMFVHKQNKVFVCNICGFSTPDSPAFVTHNMVMHTDEKPFGCTLCGFRAIQEGNVRKHMMNHDRNAKFKCPKCSFSVNFEFNLRGHMRKCHKQK